ncbi:thermopsin [Sulfurisphaera tokodaii]|uniref:Endopeptidase n=2 Tax=Sulfurisphaera tokodaii TaxID=111955 RepID=Q96X97_SULTO|nr:thermopsin [Sulfurisphaera tokodaii]BAB67731.1 putative endopeptidase [Sulfurisphaera tokodaii str. 7]HII75250.1 thermopsin family protease [Sulfurisphaera tokodaii]
MEKLLVIFLLISLLTCTTPLYTTHQIGTASIPVVGKYFRNVTNNYGYVNINAFYSSEPAPMGIADYGIGPNGPYVLTTTQFLGYINIIDLSAQTFNGTQLVNNCVSFQLNAVLTYNHNGITYSLWVQNIVRFDTANNEVAFLDNIWNYTQIYANASGLSGNGQIGIVYYGSHAVEYYYDWANNYPGSFVTVTLPTTILVLVNVSVNSLGQPVINFWYNDGYGWVKYDTVVVTNVEGASNVKFMINGNEYTGWGTFYDAELVLGGAYGGLNAYVYSANIYMNLEYWNGHNFQTVENAYNFGSDTAETVQNVVVTYTDMPFNGTLVSHITTGTGSLGVLWEQNNILNLTVDTGISSGYILVYNMTYTYSPSYTQFKIPFNGGEAILALEPTNYAILVYNSNGQLIGEANVLRTVGSYTTDVTQFNIIVSNTSIRLHPNSSALIDITINAYGDVKINILTPTGVTYNIENPIYVNGQGTDILTIYASQIPPGTYPIIINASLFPGFYKIVNITLTIIPRYYFVIFEYNVIGQPLPQSPQITLEFPNQTITTIYLTPITSLKLPAGTIYTIQQIIYGNNGIRWATDNQTEGVINSTLTIFFVYYEQLMVNFEYKVQGGVGYSPPQVTYYYFGLPQTITAPNTVWVDYDSTYVYSQTLPSSSSQERWIAYSYSGTVTVPSTITIYYYNQYHITVLSPIPVHAIINGTNTTLTTGWYDEGTTVEVLNITYYPTSDERCVIVSISPSSSFTVNSSINVIISTVKQFPVIVSSPIPVYAVINGTNTTLTTGWYNVGSVIRVENITYYPNPFTRYVITNITPKEVTVESPLTIKVSTLEQFYLKLSSPIPVHAIINGTNTTLTTGWYNKGIKIEILNITYYPSSESRYVITQISPSAMLILNKPYNVTIYAVLQFYVSVSSKIPVKALINGTETILNSSWINEGTKIDIINYTYYINNEERCVITNISPKSVTVENPTNITIKTVKQFLVTVNGASNWYNKETRITLNASVPFYLVGEYIGTYNVSPRTVITVNGPIYEKLVETPNYPVLITIAVVIAAAVAIAVVLMKKR